MMSLFFKTMNAPKDVRALKIRQAMKKDATEIVRLSGLLSKADSTNPSRLTEEIYCEDGFGDNPAFNALLAEIDTQVIGYTLYFEGYDTNRAKRGIYISDIYVDEAWRRQGVGRSLMQATAQVCRDLGGEWVFWAVNKQNRAARKFYQTLATEISEISIFAALGQNFLTLCGSSAK